MELGEIEEFFDTTAAGQKIIDIGRMLSEVEMRAPDGTRQDIASIAFSDQLEVQRLVREINLGPLRRRNGRQTWHVTSSPLR